MRQLFSKSLRLRLALLVSLGVVLPTLAIMLFASFRITQLLRQNAERELELRVTTLADSVSNWDNTTNLTLRNLSVQPDIVGMKAELQKPVLEQLVGVYSNIYLAHTTDTKGLNVARSDDGALTDYSDRQWFLGAITGSDTTRQTLIGRTSGEPALCLSTPIRSERALIRGVASVCTDLTVLTEQVGAARLGETGFAFLVDDLGQVLAHPDPGFSAELKDLSDYPPVQAMQLEPSDTFPFTDQDGVRWLSNYVHLDNGWGVVVQQQEAEVLAQANTFWQFAIISILIVEGVIGALIWLIVTPFIRPISELTTAAMALSAGQLSQTVAIKREDELGILARAFNSMAVQLQEMVGGLEQRVAARTRRLEIAATLSERMNAILRVEELLAEVVNQIKDSFGYYHAHIYLLDEKGERLVVAEGTGQAGAEMKAKGHNILLNAPTSLVARAARSSEIVRVDNVREATDWLPNTLLPNTYSEMAVPILREGRVVGVLDVQEDEVAGLDEGDANLLRSLANQVAVAIHNARLFEEVEAALTDAYAAHERYLEQAWEKAKAISRGGQYLYTRSKAKPLDEAKKQALVASQQQVLSQSQPVVITPAIEGTSVVAPITLYNQAIGALQLHTSKSRPWTEGELAVLEAVADQFAQTAENLRLFEETRERGSREQMIREITEKMRAASSLEGLVKTAAEELGRRFSAQFALVDLGIDTPAEHVQQGSNGHDQGDRGEQPLDK